MKYQELIEGIAEQDLSWLISRLREDFPGLWDGETDVNGADLVDWLTYQIHELQG